MVDVAEKFQILLVTSWCLSFCTALPQDTTDVETIVRHYFNAGYTVMEIVSAALFVHHIVVSERTVQRYLRRLNLRRRCEDSLYNIVRGIQLLHGHGYNNYGYRWIYYLLNRVLGIRAYAETVRHALSVMDPEGVSRRQHRRLRRRQYVNRGPNFVIHIDGYDKLKPFGISIHGPIDGFSRKIVWLKAGPSNKNPHFISHYYLSFLMDLKRVPRVIRVDDGTENNLIRDIQIALRMQHADNMSGFNSCSTGRSTANQRIEMLWSILMRGFTCTWRNLFKDMVDEGMLDNTDPLHLECILVCFLPTIQKHLDRFLEIWNGHRIRRPRNNECPSGIPNIMYEQPFLFGASDYSFELPCGTDGLKRIAQLYCQTPPLFGCSTETLEKVQRVSGLNEHAILRERSPTECKDLFDTVLNQIERHL